MPLALHRSLDALGCRARHAGGGDDFCLALRETVEGRRHRVDALLRYNSGLRLVHGRFRYPRSARGEDIARRVARLTRNGLLVPRLGVTIHLVLNLLRFPAE